jgi:predicted transcriptional regulator
MFREETTLTPTFDIAPEAEARLRHLADMEGEEEGVLAARLLNGLLTEEQRDFEEAVEAVREGLADLDTGDRGMLLEDYRAQLQAERRSTTRNAA